MRPPLETSRLAGRAAAGPAVAVRNGFTIMKCIGLEHASFNLVYNSTRLLFIEILKDNKKNPYFGHIFMFKAFTLTFFLI